MSKSVGKQSNFLSKEQIELYNKHILLCEQSKLSQRLYCKKHDLNIHTFCYLRAKLLKSRLNSSSSKFAEVKLSKDRANAMSAVSFSLHIGSKYRVELPLNADSTSLFNIFSSLGILS